MKVVTFSNARTNLKSVLDRVVDDADDTVIARRNRFAGRMWSSRPRFL